MLARWHATRHARKGHQVKVLRPLGGDRLRYVCQCGKEWVR
jgi:hypothetical protein